MSIFRLTQRCRFVVRGLVPALLLSACASGPSDSEPTQAGPRTVQPGSPGQPTRVLEPAERTPNRTGHIEADVRFMQDMIVHHAQALEMSALAPERTTNEGIHLLARRIEVSQTSEIALMERWLVQRGEALPAEGDHRHAAHGADDDAPMGGMLTPEEMARLRAADNHEFDRLFLELMIRHHEGALAMVDELLSTPGAAQGAEVFQLAAHVEADQAAEIARMRAMRAALD